MSPSVLSVEGGEIRVEPSFRDSLLVHRLGGRFRGSMGWRWPATPANARMLHARLRQTRTTPEFDALLGPVAAKVAEHFELTPPERVVANAQALQVATETPVVVPVPVSAPAPEPVKVDLPAGLRTQPWRHQLLAFKFCLDRFAAGYHGILLAMMMGTGKSLVACMLVLALNARRVLIVCPLRVVPVWVGQFQRHVDTPLVIVTLDEDAGSTDGKTKLAEEKLKLAQARGVLFVCVINYDSMWREPFATWAEKIIWDLIIPDELHRAKSPSGRASTELKRLRGKARYRIGLTGTPMPHGPMDIFAQFRFLDLRIFGPSFTAFRAKYAEMGGYQRKQITGFQHLDELEALMSRITFRVGKEVLDLPEETTETYYCDLAPEGARVYREMDEDFVARVKDGTIVTAANALVKLVRLQQATGGFLRDGTGASHRIDISKLKLLADTLEDVGPEEPVVVFAHFTEDLDAVHEACVKVATAEDWQKGGKSLELSGRRDELARWQGGEAQVLAVQIKAGGVGVDLTRARYSIFYSTGFSLGDYDQAKARTHRPGQTRPVMHIHLVARGTVDVRVRRALEKRAQIVESILAEIRN